MQMRCKIKRYGDFCPEWQAVISVLLKNMLSINKCFQYYRFASTCIHFNMLLPNLDSIFCVNRKLGVYKKDTKPVVSGRYVLNEGRGCQKYHPRLFVFWTHVILGLVESQVLWKSCEIWARHFQLHSILILFFKKRTLDKQVSLVQNICSSSSLRRVYRKLPRPLCGMSLCG